MRKSISIELIDVKQPKIVAAAEGRREENSTARGNGFADTALLPHQGARFARDHARRPVQAPHSERGDAAILPRHVSLDRVRMDDLLVEQVYPDLLVPLHDEDILSSGE